MMSEIWNLSTLCRCCHADGDFKSLNSPYQGGKSEDAAEIYEVMLQETFGVTISTPPLEASYTICDQCIIKLRDASDFKNQVLTCEQKFKVYCNNEQFVATHDVKIESENDGDVFDHYDDVQTDDVQMDEKLTLDLKKEYSIEVDIKHPIEEVKKENQLTSEKFIVVAENIKTDETTDKQSEIPKNVKITSNRRKRTIDQSIVKKKPRGQLDLSLIIQLNTDCGIQFSCKDCGGCYYTQKEIIQHIKTHAVRFKCEYCPKQLYSNTTLKNHMKLHTGKDLQCPFCPKKFATKQNMEVHVNNHTKKRIFTCDICQKEFTYKKTLTTHLKIHDGTNKKKLCDLCGRSFNDKTNLNAHIRTVHEKLRPHQCLKCGKTFSNKRHLRDHSKIHDGDEKLYKCDVCDHTLSCPKTMKIHRLKHDNKFMCRFCSKIFDDVNARKDHVFVAHHDKQSCPLCGKILAGKYSLKRHIDEHNGIRRFPCDICGLKFSQKGVLDRHIYRKHNSESGFNVGKTKCDICKRSFKNIILHMDSHNNRRFACEICGKTYPDNRALNRHKSSKHFGRSFDCDICHKKYLQKAKLNTHRIKVHKVKIEKDSSEGS